MALLINGHSKTAATLGLLQFNRGPVCVVNENLQTDRAQELPALWGSVPVRPVELVWIQITPPPLRPSRFCSVCCAWIEGVSRRGDAGPSPTLFINSPSERLFRPQRDAKVLVVGKGQPNTSLGSLYHRDEG